MNFRAKRRQRHLDVAAFFSRPDTLDSIAAVCVAIGPVERLHLSLFKRCAARKHPTLRRPARPRTARLGGAR